MTNVLRSIAVVCALALLAPAGAVARGGHRHSRAHVHKVVKPHVNNHAHRRNVLVSGAVVGVDVDAKSVTVHVRHANRAGRALVDQDVVFTLADARLHVADANGDGVRDLGDVAVGDRVIVQAKVARDATVASPLAARHLVDPASHRRAEEHQATADDESTEANEAPEAPEAPEVPEAPQV
jgi:ribosomal protein S8E